MIESRSQIFEFDDFRVDVAKRLLTRGDAVPLALTPKVFDTLLCLVRNSGRVIGKDELMREIWTDTIVEENNLSQNISILRRTLGERPGEGRFIATVPGLGFRFVPDVVELSEEGLTAQASSRNENEEVDIETHRHKMSDREAESGADSAIETRNGRKNFFRIALAGVLVVLTAGVFGFYFWRGARRNVADSQIKTIAILPFKPLVAEKRDEALEMGMADTLISRLGDSRGLIVRPLSSVRRFGDTDQDAVAAGRELGVEAVLEGSIQRSGEKIRVNARLIKVVDGSSIWTGTFEEKFSGIFTVQDAISNRVATALSLRLSADEKMRLDKRQTQNTEAYQLYIRGRFLVFKLTPQEIEKGISYFQEAISLDPAYALAYAGLADAYRSLALGSEMPPTETLQKSKAAAQKAIELDESLSEAHTALGMTIFWGDWKWAEAESEFKRALELSPNSANAHLFYSHLLSNLGRHEEALAQIRTARELDPLFPFAGALEGQSLSIAGLNDEALDRLRETSELAPNFWMPHLFASGAYIDKGMFDEAVAEAQLATKLSPSQTASLAYEAYALAKSGKQGLARAKLNDLLELSHDRYVPPFHIALIYCGLGEQNEALDWLERAFDQRDPKITFLKVNRKLNSLRYEPRFIDLMRRMGFEE
jgi:DNA-binding winged helix-turn-helix (wHTH) protein/TolB-like protein